MRITLEFDIDADARSFLIDVSHRGRVIWGYEGYASVNVVEVDGKPLPEKPECTRVHRRLSRCHKTHPDPDDPRYQF